MATIINPKFNTGPVNAGEERLLKFLEVNLPDGYYIVPFAEFEKIVQKVKTGDITISPEDDLKVKVSSQRGSGALGSTGVS